MATKSSSSSNTSIFKQLDKYNPSSTNFTPRSNLPNATVSDAISTYRRAGGYSPVEAATTAAGIQASASRAGETTARNAIGYAAALAGGANNPWSDVNWNKNTQALNQSFQQNTQAKRERLMQAGLAREETKRQQLAQETSLAAA
jgi:hypothetical protein